MSSITCSVRVSNELGANHPKAAKFSVIVCVVTSTVFGCIFTVAILATKNVYPLMFSDKKEVIEETSKLGYFLAATIFLNSIQPVLHGNSMVFPPPCYEHSKILIKCQSDIGKKKGWGS